MIQNSLLRIKQSDSVKSLQESICQGIPSAVFGIPESFKNYLISTIDSPVLYVVKDNLTAKKAQEEIMQFCDKKVVYIPPKDEILITLKAFSKDNDYQRIVALSMIEQAQVIIVPSQTLMQLVAKKIGKIVVEKSQEITPQQLATNLVKLGYQRKEHAHSLGTFALRGDILDVYPINATNPVRIDFFGDNVESVRTFDIDTSKTIEFLNTIDVLQASEFIFDASQKDSVINQLNTQIKTAKGEQKTRLKQLIEDYSLALETGDNDTLNNLCKLSENAVSILDLITKETVIAYNEGKRIYDVCTLYQKEFNERFNYLLESGEVFAFAKENLLSVEYLREKMLDFKQVGLQTLSSVNPFFNPIKIFNPSVSSVTNYQLSFNEVFTDIQNWLRGRYSVLVCGHDNKKAQRLQQDLSDKNILSTIDKSGEFYGVNILTDKLNSGFIFHEEKLAVIGSGNLYNPPTQNKRIKTKKQAFFTAPEVGDYCVHEVHGVGRVLGNKKISTTEGTKDYVSVEYFGGDLLYVPVEQMDLLTRYLGADKSPRLSRIGGKDFERVKNAVKESIKKMSFDLKKLYQEREEQKGFKFTEEPELQEYFDKAFPYELTPDQVQANQEILSDMTNHKVMDRLVCGDVGFGKTEVAFRAAFRAIANGKQVAMLAPTTILVEQHYNTATQRFKDFGIKIASLNRFKTAKQQRQIIEDLKQGKIDFVIGTHRLLSKDVEFKDLGLLVLDEEQRFGVEHKERIKLLKSNVDALTLTATPIPRTLHMSLSGIRAISTINTPPKKRLPVQTYVTEETDALIKDAITREANRGGQSFILYNRVESIDSFAKRISSLMPGIKFTVLHGQMEERALERGILSFYRGESDVLISTTIIENGIDLPKANTLVVIDADKLGLSTLYQIKGRVGRSDRLAYAYFTYKREKVLTSTAFERLNAIIEFAEMGSGIKIAMRDLEIRGAGNILGAEQHGHMDKIGYELYSKLLKEELTGQEEIIPDLDIRVNAYIPEDYVENPTTRMDIYKEIAELTSEQEEKEMITAIKDTFGKIPMPVISLISIAIIKRMATKIKVKKIVIKQESAFLEFENLNCLNSHKLMTAVDCFGSRVKITVNQTPRIEFTNKFASNNALLSEVREFLTLANT